MGGLRYGTHCEERQREGERGAQFRDTGGIGRIGETGRRNDIIDKIGVGQTTDRLSWSSAIRAQKVADNLTEEGLQQPCDRH